MIADIRRRVHTVHLETFVWTAGEVERQFVEAAVLQGGAGREGAPARRCARRIRCDARRIAAATRCRRRAGRVLPSALVESASLQSPHSSQAAHRRRRDRLHVRPRHRGSVARRRRGQGSLARHGRAPGRSRGQRAAIACSWRTGSKRRAACPPATAAIRQLERKGDVAAHVVSSASEEVGSKVALLYTVAIASARKEVIVQNPYFAPDDGVCELLRRRW